MHPKSRGARQLARGKGLPEYLEKPEVDFLIAAAEHAEAALLMEVGWRAALRISETLNLEPGDLQLDADRPTLRVRQGKGQRTRIVPIHPELRVALENYLRYTGRKSGKLFTTTHRQTAWRWVKRAFAKAVERGQIPPDRKVGTHTLRHSCARHWLASGIPINVVQRWLGHKSLQTTLVYLEILPDPTGSIERVP